MASFESKVSEIFNENPRLARNIPFLIRQLFRESDSEFKRRLSDESEEEQQSSLMKLFDVLFIDFYFDRLKDRFLNWVINRYSNRFNKSELDELRAQSVSHLDFYEVQKVIPGKGSFIKSLFTQNELFLKDVSSSLRIVKWDIFIARCYPFKGGYYASGALILFDHADKQYILNRVEKALSEGKHSTRNSEYADFAKNNWNIFFQIEHEIKDHKKNKKFYTKYGELQLCEIRFKVNDIQALLDKLNSHDEFDFIEIKQRGKKKKITRLQFNWITSGIEKELESIQTGPFKNGLMISTSQLDVEGNQMGAEQIGSLYVDKFQCRLETRSFELAEFSAGHFVQLFGTALTFKRIIKKDVDIVKQTTGDETEKRPEQSAKPSSEIAKQYIENYYLGILDEKIPALNNLSPREARKDSAGLPLLIEWLKNLENTLERNKLRGAESLSPPIDKIKKELNMD